MPNYQKKNLSDLDLKGKKVIMRVDFNVPMNDQGEITDDKRIKAALSSIQDILDQGAALLLVTHLGRPKKGFEDKYSLKPVAKHLAALLNREVIMAADVVGPDAQEKAKALQAGQILLLENVRFHPEETKNDPTFAKQLASMADLYVNDAFGTAHRAHASTEGLAHFLPSAVGHLVEKELQAMGETLNYPDRPFTAILGGAKVSDKIQVIKNLLDKVDNLLIGGAMAFTFLKAQGAEIGKSLCEEEYLDLAKGLLAEAKEKGVKLYLPEDVVEAAAFAADADHDVCPAMQLKETYMGLDIGPKTRETYREVVLASKTVVWNGPMGVFEMLAFAEGTKAVAQALADSKAVTIIGGGDSAAAIKQLGLEEAVTHVSTGGGASLELLEGKTLPGIDAVMDKKGRRIFACGNRKMNLENPAASHKFNLALLEALAPLAKKDGGIQARMGAGIPYTALPGALEDFAGTDFKVLAENCHFEDKGAYTGEISPKALAEMGVWGVILGHSERREYFAETDELINKKIKAARAWGLQIILCCGESLAIREEGTYLDFIRNQIQKALAEIPAKELPFITIAYEPIWAIGTGKTASTDQAEEVCREIRKEVASLYSKDLAEAMTILYGGSVNDKNAAGLFGAADIDGGLIGGACLKADGYATIVDLASAATEEKAKA